MPASRPCPGHQPALRTRSHPGLARDGPTERPPRITPLGAIVSGPGPTPAPDAAARAFVVNSLAAKAQSVGEIERKLAARGVPSAVAEAVIDEAVRLGYLNDAELAGQLARGFRARRYGRRRAASAMRRRCLDAAVAEEALDAAYGDADEARLAERARGPVRSRTTATAAARSPSSSGEASRRAQHGRQSGAGEATRADPPGRRQQRGASPRRRLRGSPRPRLGSARTTFLRSELARTTVARPVERSAQSRHGPVTRRPVAWASPRVGGGLGWD